MIADALKEKGFEIDKRIIDLEEPIKALGIYTREREAAPGRYRQGQGLGGRANRSRGATPRAVRVLNRRRHCTTAMAKTLKTLEEVTIRFAGDSGDGMQLTGTQFTNTAAALGNDLSTLPDYPAEIRAPAGTTYGVSGFQIKFGSTDILTPGDSCDVLVAMNPAALVTNLKILRDGGTIIVNEDAFTDKNLKLAGLDHESARRRHRSRSTRSTASPSAS